MIAEILNTGLLDTGAIVDVAIVMLLVAVGVYIVRLNRRIDRLRAALVEAGPMFETYENAIRAHRDSMAAFNAQMETKRAEPVVAPASEPVADPVIEFRRERVAETTPEPAADAVPEPAEEDLSAVFYRKFVKEAV